ncbi:hypothetical protein J416_01214 [Gracilibacillus halophilus YIM-C55.5]|uniref:Purine nucleoside phosphorylase n=2 Tax=Gracilibacillus TaxID=74385 RepID=N4WZ44_9BACI|nr:hypothetical protein J416_01214 [Gracilibacillus halophilus YIM-C55.5]
MTDTVRGCDGLVTRQKNLLLTALFADCVPLFFYEPEQELIGISHAGWRGTTGNIAGHTVEKLVELGARRDQIEVVIAPSICSQCYQVDQNVIDHIPTDCSIVYEKDGNGYHLDLKKLNQLFLRQSGIVDENIMVTDDCTAESELLYSHRHDPKPTGRMLGFIYMTKS